MTLDVSKNPTFAKLTSTNPADAAEKKPLEASFKGVLDEIRIYARPLSIAEIQADMNAAIGN